MVRKHQVVRRGFNKKRVDPLEVMYPRERPTFHVVALPGKPLKPPRKKILKAKKCKNKNPIKVRRGMLVVKKVKHPNKKSKHVLTTRRR